MSYTLYGDDQQHNQWWLCINCLWVAMTLFTVGSALVGIKYGTCKTGTPDVLYYCIGSIMSVSFVGQVWLFIGYATSLTSKIFLVMSIVIGLANLLDYFTDGQQLSLAVLCDGTFHDRWIDTIEVSWFSWFAGIADRIHMYGCLAISLILCLAAQLVLVYLLLRDGRQNERTAIIGDFVGLGALPKVFLEEAKNQVFDVFRAMSVGLFESLPGFYLQTSLFSLTFAETDDATKSKQLISLALTGFAVAKLGVTTLLVVWKAWTLHPDAASRKMMMIALLYVAFAFTLCVVNSFRIWFSYKCADHLWNLTSGCVDVQRIV